MGRGGEDSTRRKREADLVGVPYWIWKAVDVATAGTGVVQVAGRGECRLPAWVCEGAGAWVVACMFGCVQGGCVRVWVCMCGVGEGVVVACMFWVGERTQGARLRLLRVVPVQLKQVHVAHAPQRVQRADHLHMHMQMHMHMHMRTRTCTVHVWWR